MEYKKISVLIVTYKQADVIGRNLDSILQQKEYGLHEIVICDDCSPDNNWEVIQGYVQKYPNIIRAYRNNPNLGIYGNSDKCASLHGDADLFCWLEGDDALCDGFFKAVQESIINNDIDVSEPIAIQSDYMSITAEGASRVQKNDYLSKHTCNPVSAKIRGLTSWRASVFSRKVIEQFTPTILDRGLALAENLFDSQWFRYTKKVFYLPIVGSIYYTGIGVSVDLGFKSSFMRQEAVDKWTYLLHSGFYTEKKDIYWIKYMIAQAKLVMSPHIFNYVKCIYLFSRGRYPQNKYVHNFKYLTKILLNGR